ncbi:MAG TPA: lysine--tRNA ligase [Acidimicrobiales bacterium]|nr:lysine--tRNA ligase [Acidimicrobiales bacterium]
MVPVPYRFERTAEASELHQRYGVLAPGQETDDEVAVAGRVMLVRPQGRLAFATLRDGSGQVQLFAREQVTDDFDAFAKLSLGDWVGAKGRVVKTRKGELSVLVERFEVLAEARRSFGDKWKGVTDVETRFRQREVDLWANERSRQVLLARSRLVSLLRRDLESRGFVEVETPLLHAIPGGATARPFVTHHNALDMDLFLRIAPELFLKRLVVGGFDKVFEIGRVFRNEGLSPRHNPEFTMLELYQAYADYTDFLTLVEELISNLAREMCGTTVLSYGGRELDLTPPWRRETMSQLVTEATGEPTSVHTPADELRRRLADTGAEVRAQWGPGKLLLELYEKTTEADLWGPVFVTDFPAEVSPLARRHRADPELAERFEPIVAGRELGNAFTELVDPEDQRQRFEEQAAARASGDEEAMVVDEDYLRALEYGLPPTAGLGIGIDRLVMLLTDTANIREVIAFPTLRSEASL